MPQTITQEQARGKARVGPKLKLFPPGVEWASGSPGFPRFVYAIVAPVGAGARSLTVGHVQAPAVTAILSHYQPNRVLSLSRLKEVSSMPPAAWCAGPSCSGLVTPGVSRHADYTVYRTLGQGTNWLFLTPEVQSSRMYNVMYIGIAPH